jgi:replicative DNA helicase
MKPTVPQNPEAETAAVACLLLGTSPDVAPLREEHFAAEDARIVFAACRELADEGAPLDPNTVTARLRATGALEAAGGHLARFLEVGVAGGESLLRHHFATLEHARQQREAVRFIVQSLPDLSAFHLDAPAFAEELAARCAPLATAAGSTANDIAAEIEREEVDGVIAEVFPSGLVAIDRALGGGFHAGELAVVGGGTGAGKSALLIQAAAACAQAGHAVAYFSLEMPRRDVFRRLASAGSRTPAHDRAGFRMAQCEAAILPVTVYDSLSTLRDITAAIRVAARRGKAAVAVVDYLQLVEAPGDSRELAMSEVARSLKTLALAEKILVLTASQLNDDGRLRESRAIGHHADAVLAIEDEGIACRKFRRGPAGWTTPARLHGSTSRFSVAEGGYQA